MDEDEDFEALFFAEARELLDALQEHLNQLAEGPADPDTVHAAFRAVHSVKGGAAAFGFEALIAFAHIFETVMDLVRDDRLVLDDALAQVLLRAGDTMLLLVDCAEAGRPADIDGLPRLQAELEAIATGTPAAEAASSDDVPPADDAAAPAPTPGTVPPATGAASAEDGEADLQERIYRVTPEPGFFASGHDMLRLVRAARAHGLAEVHVDGEVPPLDQFDPALCPVSFELTFRTAESDAALDGFFAIYEHAAQIEREAPGAATETDPPPTPEVAAAAPEAAADTPDAAFGGGVPPNAPPRPAENGAPQPGGDANKSLRVEIARIDRLVNLVGEMLITQAALAQRLAEAQAAEDNAQSDLAHAVETMSRQLRELQESVMAIRAQPVKSVFRRMPRVVRDLCDKLGKEARLRLEGEQTEVDATVIEELAEPLTHMIRNSMDHGLETGDAREAAGKPRQGDIRLAAEHRGERVMITVQDDGRGIDRERVLRKAVERGLVSPDDQLSPEEIDMLIFHPGFSTAAEISAVSGRGVGMDVVKKKIVALGGRVAVFSTPGQGSRFVITLPLTLAVMDGMTVAVGDAKYILPLSAVVEALSVPEGGGRRLPDGTPLLERRGEYLPLIRLRAALGLPDLEGDGGMAIVVDTETNGLVALSVDELIGQRQIVLKSLEANFRKVEGISGATILGDGQVALILDVPQLIRQQAAPGLTREIL